MGNNTSKETSKETYGGHGSSGHAGHEFGHGSAGHEFGHGYSDHRDRGRGYGYVSGYVPYDTQYVYYPVTEKCIDKNYVCQVSNSKCCPSLKCVPNEKNLDVGYCS